MCRPDAAPLEWVRKDLSDIQAGSNPGESQTRSAFITEYSSEVACTRYSVAESPTRTEIRQHSQRRHGATGLDSGLIQPAFPLIT